MNFNTGNSNYEMKPLDPKMKKKMKNLGILVVVAVVLIALVYTSVFTVNEQQEAVITTFGRYTRRVEAGLHFILPFGIQNFERVDTNVIHSMEIGYQTLPDGRTVIVPDESRMITGDLNIVNVDFFLEFRIIDPFKYLFASQNPRHILRNIAQSRIRDIISSHYVDDVLTVKKPQIQAEIRELIIADLEEFDIGLAIVDVRIQDSDPADPEVVRAFRAVETARQDADTFINEALAYQNANIPRAEAERHYLLQNAEFLRQDRINDAIRQVAMFEAMFREYERSPNIHRRRMYYEAIERVLPGVRLYINTASGDNSDITMLLPIGDFMGGGND